LLAVFSYKSSPSSRPKWTRLKKIRCYDEVRNTDSGCREAGEIAVRGGSEIKQKNTRDPKKMTSYFWYEAPILVVVTISGLIYNIGMVAGPYFQGQLVQGLYDLLNHKILAYRLIQLSLLYMLVIALVQVCRAIKRFSVRIFANHTSRRMRRLLYNALLHRQFGDDTGSLMTKAISDVDSCVEGMRKFTTEIFDTGVVMIAYLAMLLYYDVRLTILACMFTHLAM
jgi:ABC-type multidrug transport system fused ATPase/permease subunit